MADFDLEKWRAVEEAVRLEDERQRRAELPPEKRYRSLPPASAEFLYLLCLAVGAKRIVEVGTGAGYSTLWLARACLSTGGVVVTLERDAVKGEVARNHFDLAGVAGLVDVHVGEARETLAGREGPFDVAFVDGEKNEYVGYAEALWPRLASGASLIADNVISHAEATAPFLDHLRGLDEAVTTVLDIGNGLSWTIKTSAS